VVTQRVNTLETKTKTMGLQGTVMPKHSSRQTASSLPGHG
jgi:hypothetical protein